MVKIREDLNGLRSGKLEKRRRDFFQVYLNLNESGIYDARKSPLFKTFALPV